MPPAGTKSYSRTAPWTRATLACLHCRQRKVKCDAHDAGQPCTPCRRSQTDCRFDRNGDRRRNDSRKHVELLQERIRVLQALVGSSGVPNEETQVQRVEGNASSSRTNEPYSVPEFEVPLSGTHLWQPKPPRSASIAPVRQLAAQNCTSEPVRRSPLGQPDELFAGRSRERTTAATDASYRQSSASHDAEKGPALKDDEQHQKGFFGPTSQAHLWSPGWSPSTIASDESELLLSGPAGLEIAVDMDSAQLKDHLVHAAFRYQSILLEVVHEPTFMSHRAAGEPSQWYSEFLEYSLLASAARLSTSAAVRALTPDYVKRARAAIVGALDCPSVASLQGFIVLSEFEVTQGNDRMGWMLCGIACRMIADLGLQHKMKAVPSSPSETQPPELSPSNLIFSVLCVCIAYESIFCQYLGRPPSIPKSVTAAVIQESTMHNPSVFRMPVAWLKLCTPMAEVTDLVNAIIPSTHHQTSQRLLELDRELLEWNSALPPDMRHDDGTIINLDSTAFCLNMQYCKVRILLHQALAKVLSEEFSDATSAVQSISQQQEESARIIHQNALRIGRLFLTYTQLFGIEKTSCIMLDHTNLAATILLTSLLDQPGVDASSGQNASWLRSIVNTFEAVQPHFPIAERMVYTLEQTVVDTPSAAIFNRTSANSNEAKVSSAISAQRGGTDIDLSSTSLDFGGDGNTSGRIALGSGVNGEIDMLQVDQLLSQPNFIERAWLQEETVDLESSLNAWPDLPFG